MIKVEAIQDFYLGRFSEVKNIERAKANISGRIFTGDRFECEQDLCDYLMGKNALGKTVVKIIEVIPAEEVKEEPEEKPIEPKEKPIKKTTKKKTNKK